MTSDHDWSEHDDEARKKAEEIERLLRDMLSGEGSSVAGFDPNDLAKMAGLPADSKSLQDMLSTLQSALSGGMNMPSGTIDWSIARKTAIDVATADQTPADSGAAMAAFPTAALWLDEATEMGAVSDAPRTLTRVEWAQQTIDTWVSMAEPVALSISDTLTNTMKEQLPEEFSSVFQGADQMIRGVGGALFAMQLGQVVGNLAQEVISGGDAGIPLFTGEGREGGTLLPENLLAFAEGLEQPESEILLFLAVRELAHARLFRHSKWLRLHLLTAITEYAKGIEIDTDHLEEIAHEIDPSHPEQIQDLLRSGSLIPPRSPRQEAAHQRLETMLALIDGWVDVVTHEATQRLPASAALGEMIRRRRAAGGPSERAFSTLVGLELRPRKLREAAAMWQLVLEKGGSSARDGLWEHPDLLPTAEEIEDPNLLLKRLGLAENSGEAELDDFDRELAAFLSAEESKNVDVQEDEQPDEEGPSNH